MLRRWWLTHHCFSWAVGSAENSSFVATLLRFQRSPLIKVASSEDKRVFRVGKRAICWAVRRDDGTHVTQRQGKVTNGFDRLEGGKRET